MRKERKVISQGNSNDGNRTITLLSCYSNFQTWYDIEIDRWVNGQVQVVVKDMLDADQAFDFFERYTKTHKLTTKDF